MHENPRSGNNCPNSDQREERVREKISIGDRYIFITRAKNKLEHRMIHPAQRRYFYREKARAVTNRKSGAWLASQFHLQHVLAFLGDEVVPLTSCVISSRAAALFDGRGCVRLSVGNIMAD